MTALHLVTARRRRTPVRVQEWNASIRAGEDFKLAVTVVADDTGAPVPLLTHVGEPASLTGGIGEFVIGTTPIGGLFTPATTRRIEMARARMTFWPENGRVRAWSDYGLGRHLVVPSRPDQGAFSIDSRATSVREGGVNLGMSAATTAGLPHGRYRFDIAIDLADGGFCQVEGALQVRAPWSGSGLGHVARAFWQLNVTRLADGMLAPAVDEAAPVDVDGFPLLASGFVLPVPFVQLDVTPLNTAVLGSGAYSFTSAAEIDDSAIGDFIIGVSAIGAG